VDPCCDPDLTPAVYAGLLGDEMRRVVITDHGFMHYFVQAGDILWSGRWMVEPELYDAVREIGNARLREAIKRVRELGNPNVFAGIETDVMRDGRLTHDPEFTHEFDVILCGPHFLPWIEKLATPEEREKAWLDYMDMLLARPEVDVLSHPFRWIANVNKGVVSDDAIGRLLRWVEDRGVTLELNSNQNTPETAEVRMLRIAADRGLPLVVGTDSHNRAQILNLTLARQRLALAGLTLQDLRIPEVEFFLARKGRRSTTPRRKE
jgi:histidinol phosphatase-like PHP family hydrolase